MYIVCIDLEMCVCKMCIWGGTTLIDHHILFVYIVLIFEDLIQVMSSCLILYHHT